MKIVNFDPVLANAIQNNLIEGQILTRDGKSIKRLLCTDKSGEKPIVVLRYNGNQDQIDEYFLDGRTTRGYDMDTDLMLNIPDEYALQEGDVLSIFHTALGDTKITLIFGGEWRINDSNDLVATSKASIVNTLDTPSFGVSYSVMDSILKVNDLEDIDDIIAVLKKSNNNPAKDILNKYFQSRTLDFKSGDPVLVRDGKYEYWCPADFAFVRDNMYYTYGGNRWGECIPRNESTIQLMGTRNRYFPQHTFPKHTITTDSFKPGDVLETDSGAFLIYKRSEKGASGVVDIYDYAYICERDEFELERMKCQRGGQLNEEDTMLLMIDSTSPACSIHEIARYADAEEIDLIKRVLLKDGGEEANNILQKFFNK